MRRYRGHAIDARLQRISSIQPQAALTLTPAQAFVLTHAVAGILRSYALSEDPPSQADLEDALVDLIAGFMDRLSNA